MKIAILTQPLHTNYGGNLQNFALQKVLKDMGQEPVTIDRHPSIKLRTKLKIGYFKRLVVHYLKGAPKPKARDYFSASKNKTDRKHVLRFIETYINKTPRLYSDKAVQKAFVKNKFYALIVGSDQCWRPMYSPNIKTYFFDFIENDQSIKKLAYAASFGTSEWEFDEQQTKMAQRLIKQFDAVSVREKQAVELVKDKLNVEASFVLDPTLLLDKEDYLTLINAHQPPLPTKQGVYTYVLDTGGWKGKIINQVAKSLNSEVFNNQPKATIENPSDNPDDYVIPSIEGWIKGFIDADFVVTDSFHGTVFSILFNKPFVSLLNSDRGASRFYSILSELGLENRLVTKYDYNQINALLNQELDWQKANEKLIQLKQSSKVFLEKRLC
ncbi:polysaccharide pyruvyl transferase family protein [Cycloclasticus pugetii]|uniref:polysaccharide pyruvyl transferase family protein n=1 Tax=Cycloclasticus pugetii TaxID=34068 RepID=UPI003A91DD94